MPAVTEDGSASVPTRRDLIRVNAINRPPKPMKVVRILSDVIIGCSHARIRTAMPDIPNNTIRNMSSDLSLIAFSLSLKSVSTIYNEKEAVWLAVSRNNFRKFGGEY